LKRLTLAIAALAVGLAVCAAGCGSDGNKGAKPALPGFPDSPPGPPAGPSGPSARDAGAAPSPTAGMPPLPKRDFQERDFAESDVNRDPFRSFAADLAQQSKRALVVQRKVHAEHFSLEELKLVGIIAASPSRALLIDPTGLGYIVRVGEFVGKSEVVHSGGPTGADVPINWRIDRIRPADVVFIREDPSHPEIPPTTRVVALRTLEETVVNKLPGVTIAGRER
jgi:type IV pilus assembly protein PilP